MEFRTGSLASDKVISGAEDCHGGPTAILIDSSASELADFPEAQRSPWQYWLRQWPTVTCAAALFSTFDHGDTGGRVCTVGQPGRDLRPGLRMDLERYPLGALLAYEK